MTRNPGAASRPKLAVVVGSGMGGLADELVCEHRVRFEDIDGAGACTVPGHTGEVREGTLAGRPCALVMGRRHFYEGHASAMLHLIAWLAEREVTHLLVTSAAGALNRSISPGEIVVVRDLIDLQNRTPHRADPSHSSIDRPAVGTGLRMALDACLVAALERAAVTAGVAWHRGTLVCGSGPAYETAAEVRSLQVGAGDVATMSAAPEVVAANRIGLPVAVAALVTNPGTGIAQSALSHGEVLEVGRQSVGRVGALVTQLIIGL